MTELFDSFTKINKCAFTTGVENSENLSFDWYLLNYRQVPAHPPVQLGNPVYR